MNTIKERREEITARLKRLVTEHAPKLSAIQGELIALRHECQHPNMKTSGDSGWGHIPSTYRDCPDCGFHSVDRH